MVTEGYLRSSQMDIPDGSNDLEMFLESVYSNIHGKLAKEMLELKAILLRFSIKLQLQMVNDMLIDLLISQTDGRHERF